MIQTSNILIIVDDQIALDELTRLCKNESFNIMCSQDGHNGFEIFKNEQIDIVITDINVPGIDGMELLKKMKSLKKEIPVIMITGYDNVDHTLNAIRLGALDYLKKPIDLNEFHIALGRAKDIVNATQKVGKYPSVLMADDEDVPRRELARFLEKEGYYVSQACNGEEALDLFKEKKFEIILLDIKMPKMSGIEALHKMSKISDDFAAIILTGYGDESSAIQALRDGAFNFLKKPVDLDELLVTIEKGIENIVLKRSFKYKVRELELANQIVAQLSENEENAIFITKEDMGIIKEKGIKILNTFSDKLFVFDEKMKILELNQSFIDSYGKHETIDQANFLKMLFNQENEINFNELNDKINEVISKPIGSILYFVKENLNITFISSKLKTKEMKKKIFFGIIKS